MVSVLLFNYTLPAFARIVLTRMNPLFRIWWFLLPLATLKKRILKRNFEGHFTIENRGSANLLIRAVEKERGIKNINIRKGDVIRPGEK